MFLSRIALDASRRETIHALNAPHVLHGAIERGFEGDRRRRLWRVDWLGDSCFMLVLSDIEPDFSHIGIQFGFPDLMSVWESKDYEPFLSRLENGQKWRFRLRANPVRNSYECKDDDSSRGKVKAHVTHRQQREWLFLRAEKNGFGLLENSFEVTHTQWLHFPKRLNSTEKVTIRTASFEGTLSIIDVELFKHALVTGIGRAKAYGCGLLTVVRL